MALISTILRDGTDGRLTWWCPGCDGPHTIQTGEGPGPRWGWNKDAESPTFTPSVLVTWSEPANLHDPEAMQRDLADVQRRRDSGEQGVKVPLAAKVCHSFVVEGRMQMLGDCTHALAGQTVPIPAWPVDDWRDA
ncbi:DUF6527 family protein [Paucibacter sp. APW11]|uniref:DUF6527 family protein n=1 Tax=Roseateles aquae TaxID=3077235 RepID=A0ABU3P715_9BURK|nr:DUF6527 family protein [Paucibacter sp. APW11]MDT8998335.1 DUF6527 family protein [Paucibacter sp. APW11]